MQARLKRILKLKNIKSTKGASLCLPIGMLKNSIAMVAGVGATPTPLPVPDYQPWSGYPDSPALTSEFPYQVVLNRQGTIYLCLSATQFYQYSPATPSLACIDYPTNFTRYTYSAGTWTSSTQSGSRSYTSPLVEANNDVYVDVDMVNVLFAKTT